MGRIRIINTTVGSETPADYILKRKISKTGKDMEKYLHVGQGKIQIEAYELPSQCPLCLTDGRVVNCNEDGKHFRCLECGNKW